jgi:sugar phosphate isomerase/epimerase
MSSTQSKIEEVKLSRVAIHTITNKPWSLAECVDAYAGAGFGGISVWRNVIEPIGIAEASRIVRSSGLNVPALVRGGFFVSSEAAKRQAAIDDNLKCIDEAAAIGAQMVVLVVGAEVGMSLVGARNQVAQGIADCVDHAVACGVKLAIEPLHPMYAADRSCVNRMKEARLICEQIRSPQVGIAVDVFHVWWDPDLQVEIELAGRNGMLFGFHVCDWKPVMTDMLNDRGLMGEGAVNIRQIRSWVEAAGFSGLHEVEIFSNHYWAMEQHEFLKKIVRACQTSI